MPRTVKALPAHVADVVQNPRDLEEHDANDRRAARYLDIEQLLDGERVAMLGGHHGDVVQTVHVWQRLLVVFVLNQLLCAAVQEADVRISAADRLAVQFQHQAQHAVGGRMLRAEVEGEILDFKVLLCDEIALHLCPLLGLFEEGHGLGSEATCRDCMHRRQAAHGRPPHRTCARQQSRHGSAAQAVCRLLLLGVTANLLAHTKII